MAERGEIAERLALNHMLRIYESNASQHWGLAGSYGMMSGNCDDEE